MPTSTPVGWFNEPADKVRIEYDPGIGAPNPNFIFLITTRGQFSFGELFQDVEDDTIGSMTLSNYRVSTYGVIGLLYWRMATPADNIPVAPQLTAYSLSNLDDMRNAILGAITAPGPFVVNTQNYTPYNLIFQEENGFFSRNFSQEGLAVKTYQSDLFNNWIKTEWIEGPGGISEVTAINVVDSGYLYLDTLNLAQKVYNMLNRIALSGGTYNDWVRTVYDSQAFMLPETPMYHGGLSKELVFQEVISNAVSETTDGTQPLGTLAGRGVLSKKHKGRS